MGNKVLLLHHQNVIELWCNGNTTDSGPVIPGSSPGSSTKTNVKPCNRLIAGLFVSIDVCQMQHCLVLALGLYPQITVHSIPPHDDDYQHIDLTKNELAEPTN